jgi:hypothetical protein
MNLEKHKKRHVKLHKALDELLADFMIHSCSKKPVLIQSISTLMEWSHSQCTNPTPMTGDSHD